MKRKYLLPVHTGCRQGDMTRDEAMRVVVEFARVIHPDASAHLWGSLTVALDRLDAIPEEPEAPAPEQKTVRVLTVDPECGGCGGNGVFAHPLSKVKGVCHRCVRAIDIPVGEVGT